MATAKSIDFVDDLSAEDCLVILFALQAMLVSIRRAERGAKADAVRAAYSVEAAKLEALVGRFR